MNDEIKIGWRAGMETIGDLKNQLEQVDLPDDTPITHDGKIVVFEQGKDGWGDDFIRIVPREETA